MFQAFIRRLTRREDSTFSSRRPSTSAASVALAFRPPSTPGALPKPTNYTFSPDRDHSLEKGIQAALPSRVSMLWRFWGAVALVLLIKVSALHMAASSGLQVWLLLAALPLAGALGGMAGWAHVMAYATRCMPNVMRAALNEMPSRYETMRKAKTEKGVRAPLWLSYAMAGIMANVVWPITTRVLRDRLGLVRWLPLRPVKRVFASSAEYASSAIRNEHLRYQHFQTIFVAQPVTVEEGDLGAMGDGGSEDLQDTIAQWDTHVSTADLGASSNPATQSSIREAVDTCMDDIEQTAAADARRLSWTMRTFAALSYATAAAFLAAAWVFG